MPERRPRRLAGVLAAFLLLVFLEAGYHAHGLLPALPDATTIGVEPGASAAPIPCPACTLAHAPAVAALVRTNLAPPRNLAPLVVAQSNAPLADVAYHRFSPRAPPPSV